MKKWVLVAMLVLALCLPAAANAETVKVQGSIQGLLSTCAGEKCTPQDAIIIAAMEDIFVLVSAPGEYHLLLNLKNSLLSRYLNKEVRVEGDLKLEGSAIDVHKAEVLEDGVWQTFWSPEIREKVELKKEELMKKQPPYGARRRTRKLTIEK